MGLLPIGLIRLLKNKRIFEQALKEIHRILVPDTGIFIMVDPFRRKGESLEAYRRRASEVRFEYDQHFSRASAIIPMNYA